MGNTCFFNVQQDIYSSIEIFKFVVSTTKEYFFVLLHYLFIQYYKYNSLVIIQYCKYMYIADQIFKISSYSFPHKRLC